MYKRDFYFELPHELIAQYPLANRCDSRLLVYDRKTGLRSHYQFDDLGQFLQAGDLLVMNNSKVIPARLFGKKASGGKVELLIERRLGSSTFRAHIKASKSPKPGSCIFLANNWCVEIIAKEDDLYLCQINGEVEDMLQQIGHIPLPPYINREGNQSDKERYQTVYACHSGSVAAPTAGLHFTESLLQQLRDKGVKLAYVTLHTGAGTFQPVRCEAIKDHKMHREQFTISEELCELVKQTRGAGKRVIAVGTTTLRSLESAAESGALEPCKKDSALFIYPGYQFKLCDALLTNFHLPESTLLMLVSAFIGHSEVMSLYKEAIAEGYRFFSYGDASLLL